MCLDNNVAVGKYLLFPPDLPTWKDLVYEMEWHLDPPIDPLLFPWLSHVQAYLMNPSSPFPSLPFKFTYPNTKNSWRFSQWHRTVEPFNVTSWWMWEIAVVDIRATQDACNVVCKAVEMTLMQVDVVLKDGSLRVCDPWTWTTKNLSVSRKNAFYSILC